MPDSSTGGYLTPAAPTLSDDALTDFLQAVVAGVTAMPGSMVRPRWQPEPPNIPAYGADWAAIGVTSSRGDVFGWSDEADNGLTTTTRSHEVFDLMCSFYGPNAQRNATQLREGLRVGQNREALFLAGMGLVQCSDPARTPVLLKEKWWNRYDLTVTIRREIRLTYPVLSILSAEGFISTGDLDVTFTTDE